MENYCYSLIHGTLRSNEEEITMEQSIISTHKIIFNRKSTKVKITEMPINNFIVRWFHLEAGEADTIRMNTNDKTVLHLSTQHSHYFDLAFLGKQVFHERDFNLIHFPEGFIDYHLHRDSSCQFMEIDLPQNIIYDLTARFPTAGMFLGSVGYAKTARYSPNNYIADLNILKLLDELQNEYEGQPVHTFELIQHICEACFLNIFNHQRPIKNRQRVIHLDEVYTASEYLGSRLHPVSIQQLASRLNLTVSQLRLGFRQVYGHTIKQHHQEIKMRQAARLLSKSDYSVKEIANILGYHPQNLCSTYKRTFGYTPKFSRS